MAIRLGSAYGKIEIDASGVRTGIESAQRSVGGFGETLRNVFTFAAGQVVAKGFSALTSGLAGMARSALDSASQLQDLGVAMETLVAREIAAEEDIPLTEAMAGAGEAAESLLADLQELAIVSPFEYTTVSQVLRVQMAFGATSETAMELTRAILNTGAALGQSGAELDRMNYNLAQALVMGDLTGANLRQLKMAGLDLAGVLEDELGMSIEEVRAALEDGSLTMEQVSEAFVRYTDENFGGAAERMSKTFTGLKSSIGDLFFFAGADLLTPALEVVTEVLGELFDEANEMVRSGMLKRIGEQLGESVRVGVTWLKEEGIPRLREWGEIFRTEMLPKVRAFVSDTLIPMWDRAREIWGWITGTAIPRIREWGEAFRTDMLPQVQAFVNETLVPMWDKAKEVWGWIAETAIPKLREWGEAFRTETLPKIREFVSDGLDWMKEKGGEAWTWIRDEGIPRLRELGETFKTEMLPRIQEFVDVGLERIREKGAEINTWIRDEAIPQLQEWGRAFVEGITPFVEKVQPRLEEFRDAIAPEWEKLLESLRGLWDKLGEAWDRIGTMWETRLQPALNRLAEALGINTAEGGSFMEIMGAIAGATFWTTLEGAMWLIEAAIKGLTFAIDLVVLSIDGFILILEGVVGTAETVLGVIGSLAAAFGDLTGLELPEWLTPGSATPFEEGLRGIADAVKGLPDLGMLAGGLGVPQLQPAAVGVGAGAGDAGGQDGRGPYGGPMVQFYGPVTVEGVQDAPSFLEQLTRMAEAR